MATRSDYETFTVSSLNERDIDELFRLSYEHGEGLIDRDNRTLYEEACKNHDGLKMTCNDGGQFVGACLVATLELPLERPTRRPETHSITYVSKLSLHRAYRRRKLSYFLIGSCLAYQFGRTEGAFFDMIGLTFKGDGLNTRESEETGDAVYVLNFDQNGFEVEICPSLRAASIFARRNKERLGITRDHIVQLIPAENMRPIAEVMSQALTQEGYFDHAHRSILRFFDHSRGRSGVARAIHLLAQGDPNALARIGLGESDRRSA